MAVTTAVTAPSNSAAYGPVLKRLLSLMHDWTARGGGHHRGVSCLGDSGRDSGQVEAVRPRR